MSDDNLLAAAFFLPGKARADSETGRDAGASLRRLLERAGASDIASEAVDASGLVWCAWGGMTCMAFLDERFAHRLLVIFFHQSSFFERLSPDENPAPELATAFAAACEALTPDVAVFVTRLYQADIDELWKFSRLVLEADAVALARQRFGLLYISEAISSCQDGAWFDADREEYAVRCGRLIFAGTGNKKWW